MLARRRAALLTWILLTASAMDWGSSPATTDSEEACFSVPDAHNPRKRVAQNRHECNAETSSGAASGTGMARGGKAPSSPSAHAGNARASRWSHVTPAPEAHRSCEEPAREAHALHVGLAAARERSMRKTAALCWSACPTHPAYCAPASRT